MSDDKKKKKPRTRAEIISSHFKDKGGYSFKDLLKYLKRPGEAKAEPGKVKLDKEKVSKFKAGFKGTK